MHHHCRNQDNAANDFHVLWVEKLCGAKPLVHGSQRQRFVEQDARDSVHTETKTMWSVSKCAVSCLPRWETLSELVVISTATTLGCMDECFSMTSVPCSVTTLADRHIRRSPRLALYWETLLQCSVQPTHPFSLFRCNTPTPTPTRHWLPNWLGECGGRATEIRHTTGLMLKEGPFRSKNSLSPVVFC